jgi:hydrogenase nickel incorporation protein HypB
VAQAIEQLPLDALDLIFVENIGNILCTAEVDLGENYKVVVASVADGMHVPEKYPLAFRNAFAATITKADLLPHVNFNLGAYISQLMELNSDLKIFPVSARKDEGIEEWGQLIGRMLWKGRRLINVN